MMIRFTPFLCFAALAACSGPGSSTEPPPPSPPAADLGCASTTDVALAVGEASVVSVGAGTQCLRLSATTLPAQYLVVTASGSPERRDGGVTADYRLAGRSARTGAAVSARAAAPPEPEDRAAGFHALLRNRERIAAARPRAAMAAPPAAVARPAVGDTRAFHICQSTACDGFDAIVGRAAYVGQSVALYVEDNLPSDGYTDQEIQYYGRLFDRYLYPIDTTAYGRESDVDGNGLVIAFLTRGVNRLTPACLGGIIVGYFVGTDLLPNEAGSNGGEVFYSAVPDPNGEAGCRVTKDFTSRALGPVLIHELQHMISYNQHVLRRNGPVEESWLNEGLSHFAEELGGRQIPDDWCVLNDCLSVFSVPDLTNAYRYLQAPDDYFLVYPTGSTGRLAERGAAWLFLRWLADRFGGTAAFTRSLVETGATGAANITALVNVPFGTLVGQWHLANWLDRLPGFAPRSTALRYTTWNLRQTFSSFHAQDRRTYPVEFPLLPDSTNHGFDLTGLLRGGSAHYTLITVDPAASPYDVRLSGPAGGSLPLSAVGIVGVARIK